jgi:hypothetical protein
MKKEVLMGVDIMIGIDFQSYLLENQTLSVTARNHAQPRETIGLLKAQ